MHSYTVPVTVHRFSKLSALSVIVTQIIALSLFFNPWALVLNDWSDMQHNSSHNYNVQRFEQHTMHYRYKKFNAKGLIHMISPVHFKQL
jgi:hypothetical protein